MKQLSAYIDEYGLICQVVGGPTFDGGDSAQRVGMFSVANHFGDGIHTAGLNVTEEQGRAMSNAMFAKIEIKEGIIIRNPNPDEWWSSPEFTSRDQQTAVVIGAGFSQNYGLVSSLMWKHIKRLGLYQNFQINSVDVDGQKKLIQGDIASPEHFGHYFRALKLYPFYPFLLIGDLFMLLNSLIIIIKSHIDPNDTSNDLNHICSILQAKKIMPTPISFLARKLYKHLRKNGAQWALDSYFTDVSSSAPPINDLFRGFLEKEL